MYVDDTQRCQHEFDNTYAMSRTGRRAFCLEVFAIENVAKCLTMSIADKGLSSEAYYVEMDVQMIFVLWMAIKINYKSDRGANQG